MKSVQQILLNAIVRGMVAAANNQCVIENRPFSLFSDVLGTKQYTFPQGLSIIR